MNRQKRTGARRRQQQHEQRERDRPSLHCALAVTSLPFKILTTDISAGHEQAK
jgi:hypothetical protein